MKMKIQEFVVVKVNLVQICNVNCRLLKEQVIPLIVKMIVIVLIFLKGI